MSKPSDLKQKTINAIGENQELYQSPDGYIYFWPSGEGGAISSEQLRWIADELDRLNKDWDDQISAEHSKTAIKELRQRWLEIWSKIDPFWLWAVLVWGLILWAANHLTR